MEVENSETRLKKLEDKVDRMRDIAKECLEKLDHMLRIARGESP